jgi:multicomponent Na+:H+ antiporter subunit D
MHATLVLPLIIPMFTASLSLVSWRSRRLQRLFGLTGSTALMVTGFALLWNVYHEGIIVARIGSWPVPYDITLVADTFSAIMVSIAGLMAFLITLYSIGSIDIERERFGFYPLVNILLMGVCGAFLTGDIFNMYVWFEVMLIASFVLLSLGGERSQIQGAIKYVTLNLMSSALFLAAVGLLYGVIGTLNMADLAQKIQHVSQPGLVTALSVLFLIAFGIKAAIFPLFFWLPASYHTPPVAITALFSALLTKVGVYALIRVFTLFFLQDTLYTHTLILILAGFTMLTGVLGAVAQFDIRRLLSFHIISQIGYLLMGLGLFNITALAGTVYFMVHVILAKSTLFLISGVSQRIVGTYDLKKLGGLYRGYPFLSILFLIPALSLAGIPPLSGFFAKFSLIKSGLEMGEYLIIGVALVVSMLTLFSMIKIWNEAFWKPKPSSAAEKPGAPLKTGNMFLLVLPIAVLALLTVALGIAAEPVFRLSIQAAEQLVNPAVYITAVLGG